MDILISVDPIELSGSNKIGSLNPGIKRKSPILLTSGCPVHAFNFLVRLNENRMRTKVSWHKLVEIQILDQSQLILVSING
jgi:hypothetical protein